MRFFFPLTPTNPLILRHQWVPNSYIQFWHSYLALAQTPQIKGSVPQDCPHLRCLLKMGWPDSLHFCPLEYKFRGSHDPLLRFGNLLEGLTEPRKALCLLLVVYYKRYNSKMATWKRFIAQGVGGMVLREPMASPGMPPSQHLEVFANLEALWTLFRRFYIGFIA